MRLTTSPSPSSLILLAAVVSLAGCRVASSGSSSETSAASVLPRQASSAAAAVVHDRTELRWAENGWRKVESLAGLPGGVLALAGDPAARDSVVSLWSGKPGTSGDRSVLHLYRHAPGRERVLLASFANPTADEGGDRGLTPSLAVDVAGDVRLTFPFPLLLRVPATGGEPERIELPRDSFSPVAGRDINRYLPVRFTPDAAPGEGWLWSVIDESRPSRRGALSRPLRLSGGRVRPAPPLDGLPPAGRVTCVVPDGPDRAIWALEGSGLWDIDLAAGRAVPRSAPPAVWRILDFARPEKCLEVALSVVARAGRDRLVDEIWIRKDDGAWNSAGPSGDVRVETPSADGLFVRPREWAVADGLLLGAGFNSGLVVVGLRGEAPEARSLDWRSGVRIGSSRELFTLPDGRLLVLGATGSAAPATVWRAAWTRAGAAETEAAQPALLTTSSVRAPDGRLWDLTASGRGAPFVRHWDGERWRRWMLPPEREWWPETGLLVEGATGRVVVTGEGPKTPAWERDETVEGGWRRFPTVLEWLAFRADSGEAAAVLPRLREGFQRRPVYGPQGRVLVGWSGALWLLRDGEWRMYPSRELGSTPWRYGFDEAGEPWFASHRERRRLLVSGGIGKPEAWRDPGERVGQAPAPARPEWLAAWFEGRRIDGVQADGTGVWWILSDGELWAAREREFVRVFGDEEPSPFRVGGGGSLSGVLIDARGHRLFLGDSPVLLPALPAEEIRLEWTPTEGVADRVALVSGGGRAEWSLDSGPWRQVSGGKIELLELPPGEHRLEVRVEDKRLCLRPARVHELSVAYDVNARADRLLAALSDEAKRAEAVARLGRMGAAVEPRLRAALERETDEARAWWLRAALQALEDARKRDEYP